VLALSDYGAEHASGTGITTLFHYLETQLRGIDSPLTFLRAAEHMHNWARVLPMTLANGVLSSLHRPLGKLFPTVAAQDVGTLAAELLLDAQALRVSRVSRMSQVSPRIVSIEADLRVSAFDVAHTIGELSGRPVVAQEVPAGDAIAVLQRAGLGAHHARLIAELYDAHNAGRIDVEANASERRFGATTLAKVMAAMLPRVAGQRFAD
jgi:uncharacterized protein YbjT (DUF2867 family)